jgi:hypothetical protein
LVELRGGVDRLMVDHVFDMSTLIRLAFRFVHFQITSTNRNLIHNTDWMTEHDKHIANDKLDKIAQELAIPMWIMNDAALNEYYRHLNFSADDDPFTSVNKVTIEYS